MKVPLFTLVHNPAADRPRETRFAPMEVAARLATAGDLNPNLLNTILGSVTEAGGAAETVERLAHELRRQSGVITVGLWDLDAWVGGLPRIIDALNASTPAVTIFEVQSPIPTGMVWQPERIGAWATEALERELNQTERDDLAPAVLDESFLELAEPVRTDIGVDYLIGLTPARIAGTYSKDGAITVYTDFFSASANSVSLVSTYQLREFAAKTRRSYEYAVGIVMLGALLVLMNPQLEYHDNTGCLFDFNENRADIASTLARPVIEASCYDKMEPRFREVAREMLTALECYPRPETDLKAQGSS